MSSALFPFAVWQSGTTENSIPANDNALRSEVLAKAALSVANAEPATPADRDVHVVGTPWGGFAQHDVVIRVGGTWLGFTPFEGWFKVIGGLPRVFSGSAWTTIAAGGGGAGDTVTALSIASGAVAVDCAGGGQRNFTLTLSENVTSWGFSNLAASGLVTELEIEIKQDATGGRTVVWPAAFKFLGGSDTAVAAAPNAVTVLSAKTFDNGTTWRVAMQESA